MRAIELTNRRFGKLVVLEDIGREKNGGILWLCKCDCGKNTRVVSRNLLHSGTKSCGCLVKEISTKHGMLKTRFYRVWYGMKGRCKFDINYIKRGTKVCERWEKFINFRDDMYESYLEHSKEHEEQDTSIDRIDNEGNYEPKNCRWATRELQQKNTKSTRFVVYKNRKYFSGELSRSTKLKLGTISHRIKSGWSYKKIINTPVI